MSADPTWARFREEMFGEPYMVWHDGADFTAISERWTTDPDLVERMILRGLEENDSVAADAIGHLELDDEAKARFAERLKAKAGSGTLAVRVAESLVALTGDQQYAEAAADVLTDVVHWGDKIDAAMALARFAPTERLIAALEAGLQDEDNLVRHHSAESLLRYAGDEHPDISGHDDDFAVLIADEPRGWSALAAKLGGAARKANGL